VFGLVGHEQNNSGLVGQGRNFSGSPALTV